MKKSFAPHTLLPIVNNSSSNLYQIKTFKEFQSSKTLPILQNFESCFIPNNREIIIEIEESLI